MKVGFTGTRHGMSDAQRASFGTLIVFDVDTKPPHFHHGACKGADAEAARLVRYIDPDSFIVAHPGKSAGGGDNEWLDQESVADANEVRETQTHFARNRTIVDETDILVACPGDMIEQLRGGTWYTIGYARKVGRHVVIIWPDGRVE